MNPNDLDFQSGLALAYIAALRSLDPRTRNGAYLRCPILPTGYNSISGWNHFLPYDKDSQSKCPTEKMLADPKLKYLYTEHAERHVLFRAAKYGMTTEHARLYCPWACCVECARAIVLAGIGTLIVHQEALDRTPERWKESVTLGLSLVEFSGIRVERFSGKVFDTKFYTPSIAGLGKVTALLDGKEWEP